MPSRIFCVLSRQGILQQLLRRALLSECHDLHPLPIRRLLSACFRVPDSVPPSFQLPDRFACPAAMPPRLLLPSRCDGGHRLPCGELLSRGIVRSHLLPGKLFRWNEHLLAGTTAFCLQPCDYKIQMGRKQCWLGATAKRHFLKNIALFTIDKS